MVNSHPYTNTRFASTGSENILRISDLASIVSHIIIPQKQRGGIIDTPSPI